MSGAARNIALYPWFKFFQNLLFWQAIWFLFLQSELSAAEAILLYAVYDIATTVLEVPSGYASDRWGRRRTLILSAGFGLLSGILFTLGAGFWAFAAAQFAMGAHIAFASGTDSALLYESLDEEGRAGEVEAQELKAWRFTFTALAISAVLGGAMALWGLRLPFALNALAFFVLAAIAFRFTEPRYRAAPVSERERLGALKAALVQPTLVWLFALVVLFYGFSHLPFIFGQPFILEVLGGAGMTAEAALLSGVVTACMMLASVGTTWIAPAVKARIGLFGILLFAFAIQIGLAAGLALSGSTFAIALLLLRKVPDSLALPFVAARIQPMLKDEMRATYVSIRSLTARLLFALSLMLASVQASEVGLMALEEIQAILWVYALIGGVCFLALAVTGRDLRAEDRIGN